ncbi:MAG: hypothetical protein HY765_01195 [Rhodomicrobium sp.]|nr:hypothetical protein [Rhodomicrobium sp.]
MDYGASNVSEFGRHTFGRHREAAPAAVAIHSSAGTWLWIASLRSQ